MTAVTEKVRDFEADLAICEAATPGPYAIVRCQCGSPVCNQFFISITGTEGRLSLKDATFIAEARSGWPYAIRRALEAEARVDKLENELRMLQEQMHSGRCWD